jgi:pimeloyl-ACP methyl ester carboxylesterase
MSELLGLGILLGVAAIALIKILASAYAREARRPPRHTAGYAVAKGLAVDPGEMGLSYDSWQLDRPDGVCLPVWEIETGDAARTAVFIHGWGQSRVDMLARIAPWREHAGRIVLYDLRGHGDADGVSDLGAGEERDLLALLERLGDTPVVLVGCSMGAVIAIEAAAGQVGAERVAAIVAYGPYDDFHMSLRGRIRSEGIPARPMTDLAMTWFRLRGLRHRPLVPVAERLSCPMLIVHGENDSVCPLDGARRLAAAAPDAQLVTVEGAAHLDAVHVDPELHERSLRSFFDATRM